MSTPRTALHLLTPPPPQQLREKFPTTLLTAGTKLFRCHRADLEPLWFANAGHRRFDLTNTHGTCYTADTEIITLLETWAGMHLIPDTELSIRAVSQITITADRTVADLTSNTAAQFGVTAEIFTTGHYPLTQHWAAALHSTGFHGVRYWARHDLAHTHPCIALFDTAGAHTTATTKHSHYTVTATDVLADRLDLIHQLQLDTGITVLRRPKSL